MNKISDLEEVEAIFCKLTGGLVHEDCPGDCLERIEGKIPKNRIPKEYNLKILIDNLYVYWVWKSISKSEEGIYDIEEIKELLNKCKFVSKKFSTDPYPEDFSDKEEYEKKYPVSERHDIMELRKCLSRIDGYKKNGVFVPQIEPKPISVVEAYPPSEEFFGSDIIFKNLKRKIENQIARDIDQNNENLKKLRGKKKDKPEELDLFKDFWNWIEKDKEFIKQKREVNRLFNEQQPLKLERTKEIHKSLKFGLSHVLAAWGEKIIEKREAQILRFRHFGSGGTNSLREVARLLGISHTTVMNIEKRALKKIQKNLGFLKMISIKKPIKREISKEEYKKRFGYYPDQEK